MAPTPAEVRQWKRDAQRAVRLATNALRGAKLQWENASSAGLDAANSLANNILTTRYLPNMEWGVLSGMDGLQLQCEWKLRNRHQADMDALAESLESLEGAMGKVTEANQTLSKLLEGPPWQSTIPVFISLSMSRICEILASAEDMYIKEYEVRNAVVEGLRGILNEMESGEASTCRKPFKPQESGQPVLRDELQVLLAAWMCGLHFELEEAESSLGMLINETHAV
ncbi:hypothetical protein BSKO_01065 [Bryopsis sp. KO-2023]|nr:hypothetical protein BSKO_01065 [Bryopsis sp. KO-2023]